MKSTFKKIFQAIGNGFQAIFAGEFLLRIHVDRLFVHIVYTLFLLWMVILIDMRVETTMAKVEKNKETLNDMKIYHAHKTVQLVSINRLSTVKEMLEEKGSDVTLPSNPPTRIKK